MLKFNVLPCILYLIQALPVRIPNLFFRQLQGIFTRFVWAGKSMRMKFKTLIQPKDLGGIGIPDLNSYKLAAHCEVNRWMCHGEYKQWVKIEQSVTNWRLQGMVWSQEDIPKTLLKHPTVGKSMKIFRSLFRQRQTGNLHLPPPPFLVLGPTQP